MNQQLTKTENLVLPDTSSLRKTLFLDIETVSEFPDFSELPSQFQKLWATKCRIWLKEVEGDDEQTILPELYIQKAGIFAEFAKIVCISMGFLHDEQDEPSTIRIKSISGDDEKALLFEFGQLLEQHYPDGNQHRLCGHNIREFDIPFLCRRMMIHRVPLPAILSISGKKPWQTTHILDTLDMWRFGDYKNYTSLQLLSAVMGIPSPKDDIDGSQVGEVYWNDKDLPRIVTYCQKDVVTVIQLVLAFSGLQPIEAERIEIV